MGKSFIVLSELLLLSYGETAAGRRLAVDSANWTEHRSSGSLRPSASVPNCERNRCSDRRLGLPALLDSGRVAACEERRIGDCKIGAGQGPIRSSFAYRRPAGRRCGPGGSPVGGPVLLTPFRTSYTFLKSLPALGGQLGMEAP